MEVWIVPISMWNCQVQSRAPAMGVPLDQYLCSHQCRKCSNVDSREACLYAFWDIAGICGCLVGTAPHSLRH